MKILSCLVLVSCAFLGITSSIAQDLKEAETLYAKGDSLYIQNKYQDGIEAFEKARFIFERLKNIPGQIKSQNLKAECFANLGQCDQAMEILQRSLLLAAKNLKEDHPEVANTYHFLSRTTGGCARKIDDAIVWMHKSITLKNKLYRSDALEISTDYNFLGYLFDIKGQPDSAVIYLNKALAIRKKKLSPDDIEIAHTLYNMARVYENKSELKKALDLHQQAFAIRRKKFSEDNPTISNSLTAIGNVYQKFGNYDRALDYYQRALDIRKKTLGEEHANVAGSYYSIGNLYNSMLDYHSAIQYYQQGNRITEKNFGAESDILPTYYAVTGKLYGLIGDNKAAVEYIKKAKSMAEKNLAKDHPFLAIVYGFAGDYFAEINDLPTQAEYFRKAISIFQKAYGPGSVREGDVILKMADVNTRNKHFREANGLYDQALEIFKSKMGSQNPKVASVHLAIGDLVRDQGRFHEGLKLYQKAFASISVNFKDTMDLISNPKPEELESKLLAVKIAASKAQIFRRKGESENKILSGLQQSLSVYQFAMELIESITADYSNENSKVELEKQSRKIYNAAIDVAYELYQQTKDKVFMEEAFAISEKSRSVLLLENIRDSRAKSLAGVPDSLTDRETDIKVELAFYKSLLYQAKMTNDPLKIQTSEQGIFEMQHKYDKLKNKLEREFPAYYNLKYKNHVNDIADVQKLLLDRTTALVEFFVADSFIYSFSLTKNNAHFERKKKDFAFENLIHDYEKSLTDIDFILDSRNEADRLYTSTAYLLYDFLLCSTFKTAKIPIRKLIIIPDDMLGQFNFGTLITSKSEKEDPDYETLDYLTKGCQISYVYSTSFMKNDPLRKHSANGFAGFAPSYNGNQFADIDTVLHPMTYMVVRNGNLQLPGAKDEVKSISAFMNGKAWLDREASETNFKNHAGEYKILHLAMHSLLNSENPEYSELLFNHEKDQFNDGFLKVSEIYNLKLNADLVVLSACSSGYGRIQKGEGPISISRAFSYAGCPSVVMSLWKVPDDVTRQIMSYFYEELENVKQKDEALRLAQLKFLNETEDPLYHHPYFWAGFVVVGDTTPITTSSLPVWVYVGIGVVILAMAFVRVRSRRVHSSASRS